MTRCVVVGGGLAGLTSALRLAQRGIEVTLLEASSRFGGKAGADQNGDKFHEHGWHLFPLWYLNIWDLVDELGIRHHFEDRTTFGYMRPAQYPDFTQLRTPFSPSRFVQNVHAGLIPPLETILYNYLLLDLCAEPFDRRAELDQISVTGFARSRFYATNEVAEALRDSTLRATSVAAHDISAMTVRNVMRFWFSYNEPWFRILKGNLQQYFIDPIVEKLTSLRCDLRTRVRVTGFMLDNAGRMTGVRCSTGDGEHEEIRADQFISAIPHSCLFQLLDSDLYRFAPSLGSLSKLESYPMAGLTLHLKRRLPKMPRDHLNLLGSRFDLSVIDVGHVWSGLRKSELCVISSDFRPLTSISESAAYAEILRELSRFLPIEPDDIESFNFQPHVHEALYANTVGSWPNRPSTSCEITNFFLAGEYCKNAIDLTCMEGAVLSGLNAANAVAAQLRLEPCPVLVPTTLPTTRFVALRNALAPVAFAIHLLLMLRRTTAAFGMRPLSSPNTVRLSANVTAPPGYVPYAGPVH